MEWIKNNKGIISETLALEPLPQEKAVLKAIKHRPYWKRIWILQEIALARALLLSCGSENVHWRFQYFVNISHSETPILH
jgi:hypothetical protein